MYCLEDRQKCKVTVKVYVSFDSMVFYNFRFCLTLTLLTLPMAGSDK